MLEAYISLRLRGEKPGKRRGDVLVVKLAGSPWGEAETRVGLVVEWEDDELEKQLLSMRSVQNPWPVISNPYAVDDDHGEMVERSTEQLDLTRFSAAERAAMLDPKQHVPKVAIAKTRTARRAKPEARR